MRSQLIILLLVQKLPELTKINNILINLVQMSRNLRHFLQLYNLSATNSMQEESKTPASPTHSSSGSLSEQGSRKDFQYYFLHRQEEVKEPKMFTKSSRTVYMLPLILLFLFYTGSQSFTDPVHATQKALQFGLLFIVLLSAIYLPDGLIRRPTVYLWKSITGMSFFYLAVLIYFVYLDRNTAISSIRTYFDKSLTNYNYQEASYAADCRIYAPEKQDPFQNIRYAFFDMFAFAHAAGWFVKTLVVRDPKIIIFQSLVFEMIEYSLRNVMNNFKECWWDHAIIDFLGCNMVGIVAGFYVIDKFKLERYRWSFRDAPLETGTLAQIKYFFTHWNLKKLQMKSFAGLKKFLQLSWFCLFFQLNDISVFFLKYIYEMPPSNYLVLLRVTIIGLLGVNSAKEFYCYLVRREKSFKINCFMVQMIVLTEAFLIWKHGWVYGYGSNGVGIFAHAFFTPLNKLYLGIIVGFFIFILVKVLISDILNYLEGRQQGDKDIRPVSCRARLQLEKEKAKEDISEGVTTPIKPKLA